MREFWGRGGDKPDAGMRVGKTRQKYKRDLDDLNDLFGVEDDKNLNGGEEEKKRDT